MITVEAFGPGGAAPVVAAASRVLVRDAHGNPLAVVVEHAPGQYLVAHHGDPDFDLLLGTLGARAAVVRHRVHV